MVVRPEINEGGRRPNRPGRVLTSIALVCAVSALAHASYLLVVLGGAAFATAGWPRADFFLTSCVPALGIAPIFVIAFQFGTRCRYRTAGLWLVAGLLLFGLVLLVPRGAYQAGWFLMPVFVLLVTCLFGAKAGVGHAVTVVLALVYSATITVTVEGPGLSPLWTQVAFASVAVLAMTLLGATLQRTLDLAISAEEDQSVRMDAARRALRHRENLLRHAMRIETVSEMSSMVVHQLRNQFQLVLGYAAVGAKKADAATQQHFGAIVDTLGKSNDLLEGLLGMSRAEAGGVEPVDLTALCEQVCETYRKVLPARVAFELEVPDHAVVVQLNAQGLEHALLNLVINARQAMRADGTVSLRLSSSDGVARLEVEDTGSGIPSESLEDVFKPFFTTKAKGEGTGLGLAAVQRFVIASRGDVSVRSVVGQGTVFTMTFPLEDGGARVATA